MSLKENDKAPPFELPDQDGKVRSILDWAGQWLLIYFYPKDDTPGCTAEACSLQSRLPDFKNSDLNVVGISTDSVSSHRKFADKYKLSFLLLSDEQKEVVDLYGVWVKKSFMGNEFMGIARRSFLINPDGHIARIYTKVDPATHADEVWQNFLAFTG